VLYPDRAALVAGWLVGSMSLAAAAPVVLATNLKLRTGPGLNFGIVTVMPAGATLDVVSCGPGWCGVSFGGHAGFADSRYLGAGGPAPVAAAAPAVVPAPGVVATPLVVAPYPYYYRHRYRWGPRGYYYRRYGWR
jgi:uncharacterized protein YraI